MPVVVEIDVAHGDAAVDEPAVVGGGIVLAAQEAQVGNHRPGHEGEFFHARGAVEGVQHTVVGADVDLAAAGLLGGDEVGVFLIAAIDSSCQVGQVLGTGNYYRVGVDDIAEQRITAAEIAALTAAASPHIGQLGCADGGLQTYTVVTEIRQVVVGEV
ncbi:hypothetical protein D9M68_792180 [compost metagenome]